MKPIRAKIRNYVLPPYEDFNLKNCQWDGWMWVSFHCSNIFSNLDSPLQKWPWLGCHDEPSQSSTSTDFQFSFPTLQHTVLILIQRRISHTDDTDRPRRMRCEKICPWQAVRETHFNASDPAGIDRYIMKPSCTALIAVANEINSLPQWWVVAICVEKASKRVIQCLIYDKHITTRVRIGHRWSH